MNPEFRAFVKWKGKKVKVSILLDVELELRAIRQP